MQSETNPVGGADLTGGRKGTVVAVGAALSANKGAASMLQALVDNIDEVIPGGRVVSLSAYPDQDRAVNRHERLQLVSFTPYQMLLSALPLALLIWLARVLGLSGRTLALTPALREVMDSAVVADLSGISFVDGRGFPTLVYNTLIAGIPLLVGAPVVKCSQAIGPFRRTSTRLAASAVLPRMKTIVARGPTTSKHLAGLGLTNVREGADLAFSMHVDSEWDAEATSFLGGYQRAFAVISPSSVVKALCSEAGLDYPSLMAEVADAVVSDLGLDVVLIAHSARPSEPEGRMNDLPVCRDIVSRVSETDHVRFIDESLDPALIRVLISEADVVVTSRFHAMISALATSTPTVVVGWSHKYREVMTEFGLDEFVLAHGSLDVTNLIGLVSKTIEEGSSIRQTIAANLSRVQAESAENFEALRLAVRG